MRKLITSTCPPKPIVTAPLWIPQFAVTRACDGDAARQIVEDVTGKPVKPTNLAAGIPSMKQHIAQLEAEKTKLLDRRVEGFDDSLKDNLLAVNRDLAIARERLTSYESQLGKQN